MPNLAVLLRPARIKPLREGSEHFSHIHTGNFRWGVWSKGGGLILRFGSPAFGGRRLLPEKK